MKWNVETVMRQLELLRMQTEDDTLRQVSLKWNEEQDSHRTYKTLLLFGIRVSNNSNQSTIARARTCANFLHLSRNY